MRQVFLFCALYIATRSGTQAASCTGATLKAIEEKCLDAHGGDKSMLEKFHKLKFVDTEEGRCFLACMMEGCEFLDTSGNVAHKNIKPYAKVVARNDPVQEKKLADLFSLCENSLKTDANKCTTAFTYLNCVADNCNNCVWDLGKL